MRNYRSVLFGLVVLSWSAAGVTSFSGCATGDSTSSTSSSASSSSAGGAPVLGAGVRTFVDRFGETRYFVDPPRAPDGRRLFSHPVTDASGVPLAGQTTPLGWAWGAGDLESAYGIAPTGGPSPTIAIIDALDDPNVEADLGVYRAQYGLPACTSETGCFQKLNEYGKGSPLPPAAASDGSDGQARETALDVEMASAGCPTCKILLVEHLGQNLGDVVSAWNTAIAQGATFVSNSFGYDETTSFGNGGYDAAESFIQGEEQFFSSHPSVSFFAGSGDWGYDEQQDGSAGMYWPAVSAYVTAIGGTQLATSTTSPWWSQTAWPYGGAGCSSTVSGPSWQPHAPCGSGSRAIVDVSAVASGVGIYESYASGGWNAINGTSIATPLVAGIYATNGWNGKGPSLSYQSPSLFTDVTSGNDCQFSDGGCGTNANAVVGYDLPTGNGFPHGSTVDTFYASPNPVSIARNSIGSADLYWGGSWVSVDNAEDATSSFSNPVGIAAGIQSVWPGEGIVQIDVPLTAPLGLTPVTATLTDAVSGVTHTTVFDVNVTACQPVACSAGQCGTIAASDGCGGDTPVTCSSCPSGEVCSDNHCCPSGYGWSPSDDECVVVCPTGKEWCAVTGTCLAPAICQERTNGSGGCRKVGNLVECM